MAQLRVRVFAARGIAGKHIERDKWVLMEVGKDRFKTDVVPSGNPSLVWNEECTFDLPHGYAKAPLILTVQSRDKFKTHVAGVLELDPQRIKSEGDHPPDAASERWAQLVKHGETAGQLSYDVCVVAGNTLPRAETDEKKKRGLFRSKSELGGGGSSTTLGLGASADTGVPEVTSISPTEGPEMGETIVVVRGKRLGLSREDILELTIAGFDCRSSLTYHSPSKITCETVPGHGSGPVIVVTRSGGRSADKEAAQFAFVSSLAADSNGAGKDKDRLEVLQNKVAHLTSQLRDKEEQVASYRAYVDVLVSIVIEKAPDMLEDISRRMADIHSSRHPQHHQASREEEDEAEERRHARSSKKRTAGSGKRLF